MKFLLCPDKFKGSATSEEVITSISTGISKLLPDAQIESAMLSDGGEGFALTASQHRKGTWIECLSLDALHRERKSTYFVSEKTAYIDMAETNGLVQIEPALRNPMCASTRGLGQMIRHAIEEKQVDCLYIGLGGSATNDGGAGMAHELGARFLDANGITLEPIPAQLIHAVSIDLSKLIQTPPIIAACDVNNPLLGENGASAIYGPQKNVIDIDYADSILQHLMILGKGEVSALIPGAGAAGGTAYGLLHYLGATLSSGFKIVSEISRLEEKIINSDVIITGEGSLDIQTLNGKGPHGVAELAHTHHKPIYAIAGHIHPDVKHLFTASYSLSELGHPLEKCMAEAKSLITEQTAKMVKEHLL